MVWYKIQGETLTALAEAVRHATGETGSMYPSEMITRLNNVSPGGSGDSGSGGNPYPYTWSCPDCALSGGTEMGDEFSSCPRCGTLVNWGSGDSGSGDSGSGDSGSGYASMVYIPYDGWYQTLADYGSTPDISFTCPSCGTTHYLSSTAYFLEHDANYCPSCNHSPLAPTISGVCSNCGLIVEGVSTGDSCSGCMSAVNWGDGSGGDSGSGDSVKFAIWNPGDGLQVMTEEEDSNHYWRDNHQTHAATCDGCGIKLYTGGHSLIEYVDQYGSYDCPDGCGGYLDSPGDDSGGGESMSDAYMFDYDLAGWRQLSDSEVSDLESNGTWGDYKPGTIVCRNGCGARLLATDPGSAYSTAPICPHCSGDLM